MGRNDQKARKIVVDTRRLDELLVALCVERFAAEPEVVVLDLDATDIPLHGTQEERFFHGYYCEHCYMPLFFLIGRHPVLVRMRSAGRDAAAGVEADLGWLLDRLRKAWPPPGSSCGPKWQVVSVDGSTLDVADEVPNAAAFGHPGASAFPQIRFVSMVENGTHVLFASRMAGC